MSKLPKKTVLITGGSNGLGYYCGKTLAAENSPWHVVLTSPSADRAESAARALRADTGNQNIYGMALELGSFDGIRAFVDRFLENNYPPLRSAVFNAGIQVPHLGAHTKDGIELVFGVNYLGHFLLSNLLLSHLIAPARLIFVSSSAHDPAKPPSLSAPPYTNAMELAHPPFLKEGGAMPKHAAGMAYASSKLCNILGAYEIDRRLQKRGVSTIEKPITVNSFDPGLMPGTALARDQSKALQFLWHYLLPPLCYVVPGMYTAAQSGRSLARLVTDPALKQFTGKYYTGMKETSTSEESYHEDKALDLWQTSVKLTGLTKKDSLIVE